MTSRADVVAAHLERLRSRGGKRTSVELTPQAIADLAWLQTRIGARSTSETICAALAQARNSTGKGTR